MNYFITLAVEGDLAKQTHEDITGMKELAAAHFEQYGAVRSVRVHEYAPLPPKQLSFSDIAKAKQAEPAPAKAKKTQSKFKPPELEEVHAYAAERRAEGKGMSDEDAEGWFYSRGRGGWVYGREKTPIVNWKLDFCACERNPQQWRIGQQKPQTQGYGPSFDIDAFEKSTYEVPVFETKRENGT